MRKYVLLFILTIILSFSVAADGCLYYFHGVNCEECGDTDEFVSKLQNQGTEVTSFEVYKNRAYFHLLDDYFTAYNVPEESRGLPVVFAKDSYFVGPEPIHNLIEEQKENEECPTTEVGDVVGVIGDKSPYNVLDTLGFGQVTGAALDDSFRPGMVALFLILLALLLIFKKEHEFIEKGSMFIGSVLLMYFLFSFGFFDYFNSIAITSFFTKTIGVIMVLISIITIRGFFTTWNRWVQKIPTSIKEGADLLKTYVKTSAGVIVLGLFATLFTLAGMDDVFFILRSLLIDAGVSFAAVPLMLYYLVIIVAPLIVVIGVFHLVMIRIEEKSQTQGPHDVRKVNTWRKHQHKVLNVIVSTLMLVIGLMLLFV